MTRPFLSATLGLSVMAMLGAAGAAPAQTPTKPPVAVQLKLAEPTGPHAVGVTHLHLRARSSPARELMVSVWYPARDAQNADRERYITAGPGRVLA
jgi:predicted dienelactone hydrolase